MLETPEVNGARQELPYLETPEINGARQSVEVVEKYVDGAWQEVWSNGYDISEYSTDRENYSGASVTPEEIRLGQSLPRDTELGLFWDVYLVVKGEFESPVIAWEEISTESSSSVIKQTKCGFYLYQGSEAQEYYFPINEPSTTEDSFSASAKECQMSRAGDTIRILLRLYSTSTTIYPASYQRAVIKNLTIDGKKIKTVATYGDERYT